MRGALAYGRTQKTGGQVDVVTVEGGFPAILSTEERERLQACAERVAQEDAEAMRRQEEKLEARRAEEETTGRKKRGRKPKRPEEAVPKEVKTNVTDPESRIMKTPTGYVQGYNAQAAVAVGQIIVAADVTDEANDVHQLLPMPAQVEQGLRAAGVEEAISSALFDAGYWSEANMAQAAQDGPELLVATTKDWKQRKALRERGCPRGRIPNGLSMKERMERKLLTKWGRALYRLRSQLAEPPFGQIKDGRGFDRFMRRGRRAARSEWRLICATHNLLKLPRVLRPGRGLVRLGDSGFRCGSGKTVPSTSAMIVASPWSLNCWLWARP